MIRMTTGPPDWQHDTFTILADAALGRPPRAWRFQDGDGYRLRFLRRLASLAGLVDDATGGITPLALDWLAQSLLEQRAILTEAWAESAETAVRQAVLARVKSIPPNQKIGVAELTERRSLRLQQSLWQPLIWLRYVTWAASPTVFQRAPETGSAPAATAWETNELAISVTPPWDWRDLLDLERIAALQAVGPIRRYQLERDHWVLAASRGATPASALALLEKATAEPLPAEIWTWFDSPAPDVTLTPGVLVTFTRAEEMQKLLKRPAWRNRLAHRLSGQQAFVTLPQAPLIRNALQRRQMHVQGVVPEVKRPVPKSPRSTDRMHFLLAALVMQELAQELELPAPLDKAALKAMSDQLPLAQQRRLERAVKGQLEKLRERLPEPREVGAAQPTAGTAQTLEDAVTEGHSLQIVYQPPPPRPPITRTVVPLRLEKWGAHTYLVAHCLQRNDTRTFRVDRVITAGPLGRQHR